MNTLYKAAATLVLLQSSWVLGGDFNVDLQMDEDGDVSPETAFQFDWNEQLYSRASYRSTNSMEQGTSTILSRSNTSLDEQTVRADLIGYRLAGEHQELGISTGLEAIKIARSEFGSGEVSGNTVVIDNQVDVNVVRYLVAGSYKGQWSFLDLGLGFNLSPTGLLGVSQDIYLDYSDPIQTSTNDRQTLALSYGLNMDMAIRTGFGVDVGFGAQYEFLPLKYDLDVISAGGSDFESVTVSQDQTTTRFSVRFLLPAYKDSGRPLIGMTRELLQIDEDGASSTSAVNYLVLGLDKRF